jgi:type IV pilus assembly protein PilQ
MGMTAFALAGLLLAAPPEEPEARISLDVREADIQDMARLFADVGAFQLVMDPGVACRVTLKMHEVRWDAAFKAVLRSCGLSHEEDVGVVRIATAAKLTEEARAERALREARAAARPRSVLSYRLSYARAAELAPLVEKLLGPDAEVVFDTRTNTLIIID